MDTSIRKVKVRIEMEDDGSAVTFVAMLQIRQRTPFDSPLSRTFEHDGKFRGVTLPKPPALKFEGETIGEFILTMP
jgi:hypothetical protein